MKTDLSKFKNEWYWKNHNSASKLKIILWFLTNRFFLKTYFPWPIFIKVFILKIFGAKIKNNVIIKPNVNIKFPWNLDIAKNVWIGESVWIDNMDKITIGNNVCLSQGAYLLTGNHDYRSEAFDLKIGSIVLEDGVWIGAKSIVCPGVICASHSVLAVGSVASTNLESYSIYRGNPAQFVRKRL